MDSKIIKYILLFIFIFSFEAKSIEFNGKFIQGHFILGKTDPAAKIKIDNKGNIIDIFIKGSSGIEELDEAAIESFNKAGPFPNPPRGMVRSGQAIIEWGFVVKG